jgi:hypothetical protein
MRRRALPHTAPGTRARHARKLFARTICCAHGYAHRKRGVRRCVERIEPSSDRARLVGSVRSENRPDEPGFARLTRWFRRDSMDVVKRE